jgi:predicted nucleotidyltransferase
MDEMVKKYLFDIQQSLVSIETFIGDKKDFSAYMQNKMLRVP